MNPALFKPDKPAVRGLALLASAALLVSAGSLGATETIVEHIEEPALLDPAQPQTDAEATGAVKPARIPLETGTEIERFCSNIADAARDRRYVLQAEELQALQQEVDKRIKLLEEKRAEYEAWLKRREEFLAKAEDGVVKIYSGMRADAAAERLAEMDADACRRHPDEARCAQGRRHPQRDGAQGGGDAHRRHGVRVAEKRSDMIRADSRSRLCPRLLLAGCGGLREIGVEPALSPVGAGLDGAPPPPVEYAGYPAPPQKRFSLWNDRQSRLFTDPRALSPGDILTVRININDRARFKNEFGPQPHRQPLARRRDRL